MENIQGVNFWNLVSAAKLGLNKEKLGVVTHQTLDRSKKSRWCHWQGRLILGMLKPKKWTIPCWKPSNASRYFQNHMGTWLGPKNSPIPRKMAGFPSPFWNIQLYWNDVTQTFLAKTQGLNWLVLKQFFGGWIDPTTWPHWFLFTAVIMDNFGVLRDLIHWKVATEGRMFKGFVQALSFP